jgi:hypothetical protein
VPSANLILSFIHVGRYFLYLQQRFEEMESKINDLRDEIETIKAEKSLLEKRVQVESEVCVTCVIL